MPAAAPGALDRPIDVTWFSDQFSYTKREERISLRRVGEIAKTITAAQKSVLPWIKLARFGDAATPKGALRNNRNTLAITGIEADYDKDDMDVVEACALLRAANLASVVYTSPSHMPNRPRWRVLCPTSGPLPPAERERLCARLNGVLGGVLAAESFTLSQAYYIGSVNQNPAHAVDLIEGRCIDDAHDLDATAIGRPSTAAGPAVPALPCPAGVQPATFALIALDRACALFAGVSETGRHQVMLAATGMMGRFIKGGFVEQGLCETRIRAAMAESGREPNDDEVESAIAGAVRAAQPYAPAPDGSEFPPVPAPPEDPMAWWYSLQRSKPTKQNEEGTIYANILNAAHAFALAPDWAGRLRWNEFASRLELRIGDNWRNMEENDYITASMWMQKAGIQVDDKITMKAAKAVAFKNLVHPARDRLASLVWDGVPRLERWLVDFAGAEDNPFNRAVGRLFLIGMAARVVEPGVKFDTMLILEGAQGIRKSTLLAVLAAQREWFTDNLHGFNDKDSKMAMQGKWLIELAELDHFSKAEVSDVKQFLSRQDDPYRDPWGLCDNSHPRQFVLAGTVNAGGNGYLRDATGARRFWPVECGVGWPTGRKIDVEGILAVRDQLHAEAYAAFKAGAALHLEDAGAVGAQVEATDERYEDDPWAAQIADYVGGKRDVRVDEVLGVGGALNIPLKDISLREARRAGQVLHKLGWVTKTVRRDGMPVRAFVRGPAAAPEHAPAAGVVVDFPRKALIP